MKRPDQVKTAPDQGMGDRVPPGQFLTTKFPVLTYGPEPKIDLNSWEIRIFGLVEQEITLNWDQFSNLQWTSTVTDFHCVTQWSQLDNIWDGVKFADFVEAARPKPEAKFVMAHCYGGYTANLPLNLAMEEGILAHKQDGEPMGMSHGLSLIHI